jgi:hypothetical protein
MWPEQDRRNAEKLLLQSLYRKSRRYKIELNGSTIKMDFEQCPPNFLFHHEIFLFVKKTDISHINKTHGEWQSVFLLN